MKEKIFDRRQRDWTYHSVYVDDKRIKTKRVMTWHGKNYDVKIDDKRNAYFIDDDKTKWIIKFS